MLTYITHCQGSNFNSLFLLCVFTEEELRKLREEANVDLIRQELDRERTKRLDLEQKMNDILKNR